MFIYHSALFSICFVYIFVVHNIDEYLHFDDMPESFLKLLGNKARIKFMIAQMMLTILVIFIMLANALFSIFYLNVFIKIMVLSLLVNGIHHCLSSILYRRILPGTITSVFMLLPFTVIVLFENHFFDLPFKAMLFYFIAAFLFMMLCISTILTASYLLIKNLTMRNLKWVNYCLEKILPMK